MFAAPQHPSVVALAAAALIGLSACGTQPALVEPEPAPPPPPAAEPPPMQEIALRTTAPEIYVVQPGDTLWGIANRYLRDPWFWPEIWFNNEQINNPHLIFPGDRLEIIYRDGRPGIQVAARAERALVRLSPRIREESLGPTPIPPIPIDAISAFLKRPQILPPEELNRMPYVLDNPHGRLMLGAGDEFYARGFSDGLLEQYSILRAGSRLVDPASGETLGFEAIYLGDAQLLEDGDPAILRLSSATREILGGDRLLPLSEDQIRQDFVPRAPAGPVDGLVVSLYDEALGLLGELQVVALNLGDQAGILPGDVLAVFKSGRTVRDPYGGGRVTLPDRRAGLMVVFRTYARVSYALIMDSLEPIGVGDRVSNP